MEGQESRQFEEGVLACVLACVFLSYSVQVLHQIDVLSLYILILPELSLAWGQKEVLWGWLEMAWMMMEGSRMQLMCKDKQRSLTLQRAYKCNSKGTGCFLTF